MGDRFYTKDDEKYVSVTTVQGYWMPKGLLNWLINRGPQTDDSDEASFGTNMHNIIEQYLKKSLKPEDISWLKRAIKAPKYGKAFNAWKEWFEGEGFDEYVYEKEVYHPNPNYAGKMDFYAKSHNRICDWKFGKSAYPKYFQQGMAYGKALSMELDLPKIPDVQVVLYNTKKEVMEPSPVVEFDPQVYGAFLGLVNNWYFENQWKPKEATNADAIR